MSSGAILIASSFLKSTVLCHGCPSLCLLDSCLISSIAVVVEFLIGITLILHPSDKFRKVTGLITFFVLSCFALWFVYQRSRCNCFGVLSIGPRFMLCLDIFLLLLFLWIPAKKSNVDSTTKKRSFISTVVCCSFAFAVCALLVNYSVNKQIGKTGMVSAGNIEFIKFEALVGKPVSVLNEIHGLLDVAKFPESGSVIFLRGGCLDCDSFLSEEVKNLSPQQTCIFVAPPAHELKQRLDEIGFACHVLPEKIEYIFEAPVKLEVSSGNIRSLSRKNR